MPSKLLPPILTVLLLSLSACSGGEVEAYCHSTHPVFLKGEDVLSDSTTQDLITNEEAREQLCGRFDGHELFDLKLTADAGK